MRPLDRTTVMRIVARGEGIVSPGEKIPSLQNHVGARFVDILGFAKKTKKNAHSVTKTYKCHKVQNCDIVTFGNVTKCHNFSNPLYKATFSFFVTFYV